MPTESAVPAARTLCLCADDFGLAPGISAGIARLARAQRVTAVSCITTGPHWQAGAPMLREFPASISVGLTQGVYYVKIDGVGKGDPLGTGYTDYSSLGQYTITGNFVAASTVPASNVIATYAPASKTLTLTGDARANSLTVSFVSGVLKVEGANNTTINQSTVFTTQHAGKLILVANMNDGDDAISVIGIDASTVTVNLGAGNDKAAFTLSNIVTLNIDGGPGIDTLITTSTTVGTLVKSNFP